MITVLNRRKWQKFKSIKILCSEWLSPSFPISLSQPFPPSFISTTFHLLISKPAPYSHSPFPLASFIFQSILFLQPLSLYLLSPPTKWNWKILIFSFIKFYLPSSYIWRQVELSSILPAYDGSNLSGAPRFCFTSSASVRHNIRWIPRLRRSLDSLGRWICAGKSTIRIPPPNTINIIIFNSLAMENYFTTFLKLPKLTTTTTTRIRQINLAILGREHASTELGMAFLTS